MKLSRFYHVRPYFDVSISTCDAPNDPGISLKNKLAEACVSRTHRRHQRCRPPVL